jgi:GTP cyclohydrolase IA
MDKTKTVTREEAEEAVRTLIKWTGDDPTREGLLGTPDRVIRAFDEYFAGYSINSTDYLERTFEEVGGYDEIVLLKDIPFESHCEHHMAPFTGCAHIAYLPDRRVVGISKLARVVDIFARRLQIQERMTAQIAEAIDSSLKPRGLAVVIEAEHQCMSMRGVHKKGARLLTHRVTGSFQADESLRRDVLAMIGVSSRG